MSTVEITCLHCHQVYRIEVDAQDYSDYIGGRKSADEAFSYVESPLRGLLTSHLCDKCDHELFDSIRN